LFKVHVEATQQVGPEYPIPPHWAYLALVHPEAVVVVGATVVVLVVVVGATVVVLVTVVAQFVTVTVAVVVVTTVVVVLTVVVTAVVVVAPVVVAVEAEVPLKVEPMSPTLMLLYVTYALG